MLYGVGLGPGDRGLITVRALEVIKEVDEVIVPGRMAYEMIKDIREPRIVEFPMGKSDDVARELAGEIAAKDCDVAFCCLGDPVFYSTFHHIVAELKKVNPDAKVEIIPGVSSISAALAMAEVFVSKSAIITTQNFDEVDTAIVLKAKRPAEIEKRLREEGFSEFILLERMFMDGERIHEIMPDEASYFSVLIARK